MAHNYKDLHVLVLDVGPHMQPYLPLLHRLVFNVLNTKLLFKPLHEVAVVLYGTEGTRHELHDPEDAASTYPHVTVLRPLQAVGDYRDLQYFAFASDPPPPPPDEAWAVGGGAGDNDDPDDAAARPALLGLPHLTDADADAAAAALQRRVEAAGVGVAGRTAGGAATAAARAVRLFGRPGPKSDWADGLVVALDLLARARRERLEGDKRVKGLRMTLVSNFVGQSEPLDDEMAAGLVGTLEELGCRLEVAALDHYVPPPAAAAAATTAAAVTAVGDGAAGAAAGGVGATASDREALAALPAGLAAARAANLQALHGLKSQLREAPFLHLRQPAELLCLTAATEVTMTASLADLRITPPPPPPRQGAAGAAGEPMDVDGAGGLQDISLKVKLYKKVQQVRVTGWTSYYSGGGAGGEGAGGQGEGEGAAPAAAAAAAEPHADAYGAYGAADGGADGGGEAGGGGVGRHGLLREVEYEDPSTGEKFDRDSLVRGYNFGAQVVPVDEVTAATAQLQFAKDFSLLGFAPEPLALVPRHRLVAEPSVVVGADATATAALAALARAMDTPLVAGGPRPGTGAIARLKNRAAIPALVLLTPHLSHSPDVPDCLLLSPLPYFEDIRTFFFPTFRNEQEAQDTAAALAEARAARTGVPVTAAATAPLGAAGVSGGSSSAGGLLSGSGSSQAGGTQAGNGSSSSQPQQGEALGVRWEKLQPTQAQQDAASELVRLLDLGPQPLLLPTQQATGSGGGSSSSDQRPEALQPQHTVNPHLQRAYGFITSRALDAHAQLPHPDDDPLVDTLLRPSGAYWRPGAAAALAAAEALLNTTERVFEGRGGRTSLDGAAGEGDAAAEAEAGDGGDGGAGAGGGTGGVGGNVLADLLSSAAAAAGGAGAGAGGVTSVRRATAEEDFAAMLAAGKEPAARAVSQLGALVGELVESSPGDTLYGRALQLLAVLRAGAAAAGRAAAFNSLLRKLAADCTAPGRGRSGFVSRLVADKLTLLSTADLPPAAGGSGPAALPHFEDDGGAVAPAAAVAFLEEQAAAVAAEAAAGAAGVGGAGADLEETLAPAEVVVDEAFEDMD